MNIINEQELKEREERRKKQVLRYKMVMGLYRQPRDVIVSTLASLELSGVPGLVNRLRYGKNLTPTQAYAVIP